MPKAMIFLIFDFIFDFILFIYLFIYFFFFFFGGGGGGGGVQVHRSLLTFWKVRSLSNTPNGIKIIYI